jgi:hypothetical protein
LDLLFKLLAMSFNSNFNQFHKEAHLEGIVERVSMSMWAVK